MSSSRFEAQRLIVLMVVTSFSSVTKQEKSEENKEMVDLFLNVSFCWLVRMVKRIVW